MRAERFLVLLSVIPNEHKKKLRKRYKKNKTLYFTNRDVLSWFSTVLKNSFKKKDVKIHDKIT